MPRIRNLDSRDSDKLDSEQAAFPMPAAKRRRVSRDESTEHASHDTSSDEETSGEENVAPVNPRIRSSNSSSPDGDHGTSDDKNGIADHAISSAPTRISRVQRIAKPRPENVQTATATLSSSTADATFASLSVAPWIEHTLSSLSITKPTAIQRSCIPPILAGRDCIGLSQTGSGKTIAFAVPLLQKWAEDPSGIYAVVLTPTRELALQIYEQFRALGAPQNLKVVLVTGGTDMPRQAVALSQRPHIVVATPGRLADHIQHSGDDTMAGLKRVRAVVLDEADRLLAPGPGSMQPDLGVCLSALPPPANRRTLMFTATETSEIRTALSNPRGDRPPILRFEISDPSDAESSSSGPSLPSTLRQTYLQFHSGASGKLAFLHVLLQTPSFTKDTPSIMIFTNRTATADHLHRTLLHLEHPVTALHSELPQRERAANLSSFRALKSRILVATDVASRGLDIPSVAYVINYDVPRNPVDYVHRIGRTARAGREGTSVTFVGSRDVELVLAIEAFLDGKKMVTWEEEGVNLETRVVKSRTLKDVGEARMEALREVEQGRDVRGRRKATIKKARK